VNRARRCAVHGEARNLPKVGTAASNSSQCSRQSGQPREPYASALHCEDPRPLHRAESTTRPRIPGGGGTQHSLSLSRFTEIARRRSNSRRSRPLGGIYTPRGRVGGRGCGRRTRDFGGRDPPSSVELLRPTAWGRRSP
jgi:hypothetical protein